MKEPKALSKEELLAKYNPQLSDNALAVVQKRYLRADEQGNPIETVGEMFYRVAEYMAEADFHYGPKEYVPQTVEKFYKMLANLEFLPGGRILFEAGTEYTTGQLASCFVVPIEDDLEKIFESLQNAALIQKRNGGTGFNFSKVRPKGDTVSGIPNVAAGPIHYIRTFDKAFSQILQGFKRNGGNMAILNVDHPDIREFIELKDQGSDVRNFNISVGVTKKFMEAVRNDEDYDLVNPHNNEIVETLRARDIFDLITRRAWECADPGMIFLDAIEADNSTKHLGKMDATNPCGEQPLLPYESCNLGSIILDNHVTKDNQVDWDKLRETVRTTVHFMDNMLDVNKFPLPIVEKNVHKTRKIGIGIMGFAHLLYRLGVPYNSEEAVNLARQIMQFIQTEGHQRSNELADVRGTFPEWDNSEWAKGENKIPMRNATVTTIAPTGTISLVANTSSGVEPVFSIVSIRQAFYSEKGGDEGSQTLTIVDPVFEEVARKRGFYSEELMEKIAEQGSLENIREVPDDIKKTFVTTHEISYEWHIRIQAAFQEFTDNAVSKTINFPHDAGLADVRQAYIMAYELGCKGITIYRDGSKDAQVLQSTKKAETKPEKDVVTEEKLESVEEEIAEARADTEEVKEEQVVSESLPTESKTEYKPLIDKKLEDVEAMMTENAITVLEKRALRKDEKGNAIEGPQELFRRTAKFIATAEKNYDTKPEKIAELEEDFYEALSRLRFVPGQALRNSGDKKLTLSACFVLPIEDSMDSITDAIKENVLVHKATGGTGFNFSKIRAKNTGVGEVGNVAAGPVTFMEAIAQTQKTVQTKGGRGQGSMGILNIDHPDIEDFIQAKQESGALSNMNISVGITDKFMEAVKNKQQFKLIDPHSSKVVKEVKAEELFDKIAKQAWETGDPGVVFMDKIEKDNPTPSLGKLEATNPCGEQPLLPYDVCNLGSIVLPRHISEGKVDWELLRKTTRTAVHFLDNTIDLNNYPLEKIEKMAKGNRRIGLGVMGFADMLIMLGIPYDSDAAIELAEKVMEFVTNEATAHSRELGKIKGNFTNFEQSILPQKGEKHMRNCALTTIAPTGYTSIVANTSSGIEPVFALAFMRKNSLGGVDQLEVHSLFKEIAEREGFYSEELMQKVIEEGSVQNLDEVPEHIKRIFVVSHDIDPEWDVKIQAAFQQHTDNAVSKTINFENSATVDDIKKIYMSSYDLGCKGITIYRDGSKDAQALERVKEKDKAGKSKAVTEQLVRSTKLAPRERPDTMIGHTYRVKTSYGTLFLTINDDEQGQPFEIFATIGKTGGVFAAKSEAICRLVSLALRSGIDPKIVVDQIQGIRGPMPLFSKRGMILSIPDAISKIMQEHINSAQMKLELDFKEGKDSTTATIPAPKDESVPAEISQTQPIASEIEDNILADEKEAVGLEAGQALPVVDNAEKVEVASSGEPIVESGSVSSEPIAENSSSQPSIADMGVSPECPDCGAMLEFAEGCLTCRACGYSKCG
ncbi:vitamin B12-dependent ribonucleotide reductase [Patescibacteria group bacterium]